jgi:CDP-paratose 2-epimerase
MRPGTVLVTGGAGFIGANVAARLLDDGHRVVVLDALSRPGVEHNAMWLTRRYGSQVRLVVGSVCDRPLVESVLADVSQVFHFAAQVAVTTSVVDPLVDFEQNAYGTLTLLEAIRASRTRPSLVFTSTNKVYGDLADESLERVGARYVATDPDVSAHGISEARPLAFHSPYGCSKGAADQYVLDYARTFDVPAVVLRMSCIYGPRQFGTEDQGWVAHFARQALAGSPITVYGDGCQVRDVLFVGDLVDAMLHTQRRMSQIAGQPFNIGGGPDRTISLLELIACIEDELGQPVPRAFAPARAADQRYYVSDCRRFVQATGWSPRISVTTGLRHMLACLRTPAGATAHSAAGAR